MDNNLVNYFTPVDSKSYKDIIQYVRSNKIDVVFKIYDIHSKSNFTLIDGVELAISKKFSYDYESTNVLCTFICYGEPHFFRSKLTTKDYYYLIKPPEKIYKVQRRNDFRVTMPANAKHSFKINEHPDLLCEVRDISLGGCKVVIKTLSETNLPLESDVNITLQLLDSGALQIAAVVAFNQFYPESSTQTVGFKFNQMSASLQSTLHQTLIRITRLSRGKSDE